VIELLGERRRIARNEVYADESDRGLRLSAAWVGYLE
jgi:hypothetical protein